MIPKIAHFYWDGGPLPWLRAQSLITFCRHHPDWDVVLGSPVDREVPDGVRLEKDTYTDPSLPPAAKSDVWRWMILSTRGGLYSDTDVIFTRNVEPLFQEDCDAWITMDIGTEMPWKNSIIRVSIGVLGAREHSTFYARLSKMAECIPPIAASYDYQSHGTSMLRSYFSTMAHQVVMGNIPKMAFYGRGDSTKGGVQSLWQKRRSWSGPLDPTEYGIHWYGGNPESAKWMNVGSVESLPECYVRGALMVTL